MTRIAFLHGPTTPSRAAAAAQMPDLQRMARQFRTRAGGGVGRGRAAGMSPAEASRNLARTESKINRLQGVLARAAASNAAYGAPRGARAAGMRTGAR